MLVARHCLAGLQPPAEAGQARISGIRHSQASAASGPWVSPAVPRAACLCRPLRPLRPKGWMPYAAGAGVAAGLVCHGSWGLSAAVETVGPAPGLSRPGPRQAPGVTRALTRLGHGSPPAQPRLPRAGSLLSPKAHPFVEEGGGGGGGLKMMLPQGLRSRFRAHSSLHVCHDSSRTT